MFYIFFSFPAEKEVVLVMNFFRWTVQRKLEVKTAPDFLSFLLQNVSHFLHTTGLIVPY